ncbi:unnamed protein product [Parascedosporium putredinis]|uniref:Uncharacterized protein n=1 Tax=Parascedosporium putredinis TaxID=1442378 RepID=A0A9P1HC86_9PEZI|nr:unnamed protein product [Parascedosporium putredinis]CAI8004115.1 unnamed protein product [Parascedosporium putredinis]
MMRRLTTLVRGTGTQLFERAALETDMARRLAGDDTSNAQRTQFSKVPKDSAPSRGFNPAAYVLSCQ